MSRAEEHYAAHRESAADLEKPRKELATAHALEKEATTPADVEVARGFVVEAQDNLDQALARYRRIIKDSRADLSPDLVMEAYGDYQYELKTRLKAALDRNDFEKTIALATDLKRAKDSFERDPRLLPAELAEELAEFFKSYKIDDVSGRRHYENRARRLFAAGQTADQVMTVLEAEVKAKRPVRRAAGTPWTGWEAAA